MTVEIFEGTPVALKARLDALITATKTIHHLVPSTEKGKYIIIYA